MIQKITFLLFLLINFSLQSSGIILGDRSVGASDSFSFNLLPRAVFNSVDEYFYVASSGTLAGDNRKYSIAGTTSNASFNTENSFVGITPEKIILNGQTVDNPLYGAAITGFSLSGNQPVATIGVGTTLYWFTSKLSASTVTMVSATAIKDANNDDSAGVVLHADNTSGCAMTGSTIYLFAAVKPSGGDFGDANSGIALFKKDRNTLTQVKAVSGDNTNSKAVAIGLDTQVFKIGEGADNNNVAFVQNGVDLHWSDRLQRLYISLQIDETGAAGGKAVAVGYLSSGQNDAGNIKLNLVDCAPSSAFTNASDIEVLGETNGGAQVHIFRTRTMYTSTGLSYLIVQGNAEGEDNGLYALPLVDESADPSKSSTWKTSVTHGTVASAQSAPTYFYQTYKNGTQYLYARGFQVPATAPGDLPNTNSPAVVIGGGTPPAAITDVAVYNDTVFVCSNTITDNQTPGIFYSQALFDGNGKIVDWTKWQRLTYHLGSSVPSSFGFSPSKAELFLLEGPVNNPDTIKRTQWGSGQQDGLLGGTTADSSVGMIETISNLFVDQGGLMGLFDFDHTHPAFATGANNLSLMVATGYQKVAIIKTASADGSSNLIATTGDFTTNQRTFISGAIGTSSVQGNGVQSDTKIITVSGGDLQDLGPITTATLIEDPSTADRGGYLVVGGTGGLALLRNSTTRAGWAQSGLVKDLATGLGTGLAFEKIGTYTNVKKVWTAVTTGDTQALYVLTDTALYRIEAASLDDVTPAAVTVATTTDLGLTSSDSFADFIASKRLGLLATSNGLFRTGNGYNISTAANADQVGWTALDLPSSYNSIIKLIPFSTTGLAYEFADGVSGQVYYVAASVGYQNAAINRLAISSAATTVTSTTVRTVNYPLVRRSNGVAVNSPLTFLGAYRNSFASNGASLMATCPAQTGVDSQLYRLPLSIGNQIRFDYRSEKVIDMNLNQSGLTFVGLQRSSATGSWLAYGSFGLQVLE